MNQSKYVNKLNSLLAELDRATNATPYDQNSYNSIIYQINELTPPGHQRPRRRPWFMILIICSLLLVFALIIYVIFSPL